MYWYMPFYCPPASPREPQIKVEPKIEEEVPAQNLLPLLNSSRQGEIDSDRDLLKTLLIDELNKKTENNKRKTWTEE